jgi:hypothetical protein
MSLSLYFISINFCFSVRISCGNSASSFCVYISCGLCSSMFHVFLFFLFYSLCLNFVLYPNGLYSIFPCVHIPFSSCLYSVFSGSLFRLNDSKQFLSHLDVPYEDSGHDTERVWRDGRMDGRTDGRTNKRTNGRTNERTNERTITFTSKTKQKLEEVLVMPLFG